MEVAMKNRALKVLSLLLVAATLFLMVSCNFGSIFGEIIPDDEGNGVQNGSSEEPKFTTNTSTDTTSKETA